MDVGQDEGGSSSGWPWQSHGGNGADGYCTGDTSSLGVDTAGQEAQVDSAHGSSKLLRALYET